MIWLLLVLATAGAQAHHGDEVVEEVDVSAVEALEQRVDHQIQEVDDLIERLNSYAEEQAPDPVWVSRPAPLLEAEEEAFEGPPFLPEDTAVPEETEDDSLPDASQEIN